MIRKPIDNSELDDLINQHQNWYNDESGKRLILNDLIIEDYDFSDTNLSDCLIISCLFKDCRFINTNLSGATIRNSSLPDIVFDNSFMLRTDLTGCDLKGSSFVDSDLRFGSVHRSHISGTNLKGTRLPSVSMMLLANWGPLSPELCAKAMRFDAQNHESIEAFNKWQKTGNCPFGHTSYQRACNFYENPDYWDPTIDPPAPLELMIALIREKCKDSNWH